MKYTELIKSIAEETGADRKTVDNVLKTFSETVKTRVLDEGDNVRIPGFGRFWPRKIQPIPSRKIGAQTVAIPGQIKVAFRPFNEAKTYTDDE